MTINWTASIGLIEPIDFPELLTNAGLGIWVSGNLTARFSKIGYYQISALIEGEFLKLRPERLEFGKSLILVPYQAYKLSVVPIPNVLSVYSNLTIQIAQLEKSIMSINYQSVDKTTGPVVNTVIPGAIASFQVLAADPQRKSGTIYNQTNRNLWINWGITAATNGNLLVPAGANLVIPEDYTGAVQGISAAGVAGTVLSQTVSLI